MRLAGAKRMKTGRIGLALAGGGPEGAVYEIGALRALDEAIEGIDLNDLAVYVGVSAGAFVGACLANGITPTQLCQAMTEGPGERRFSPEIFFTPAIHEYVRRALVAPQRLAAVIWNWLRPGPDGSLIRSVVRLADALPLGIFDNEPIRRYLEGIFSVEGRTDDFRRLRRPLIVVAADLDSGQARRFGEPGSDHVPISKAIQASSAMPGLYPPVLIEGRYYVDGVLLKTMHASVPLDAGVGLVICVNPLVPINMNATNAPKDVVPSRQLTDLGLPMVLSQTFRTFIHSRLSVGMAAYAPRYPEQDVVLFEPRRDDYRMFFSNTLSFSSRKSICQHAYDVTRCDLLARFDELAPIFERQGLNLRRDVLEDRERDLWAGVGLPQARSSYVTDELDRALTRLEAYIANEDDTAGRAMDCVEPISVS
ncbi:MAG: patatin-like phospholipase family protein [Acidobacteriota bacterium]